ncbi:stress responsive protein [Pseudodesulfovibrio nedwellii]|uniref:Stress responsive protein n=1 Tax=Pseudodesulfovibrio nedwellii TaxID=2973072 RepID=A0ABN6S0N3_9BACT|nr:MULTISPECIES: Dabb family protein [Pseudodesulfovibrio]BDQ36784.1 stress responsive protein [Pseudodesulfovibrio nedwellii]
MIRHIVMWTLKEEAEGASAQENGAKMKEMLELLNGRIEGLQHIEVSNDIVAAEPECHIVLCSEHDDVDALNHYQGHPEHQACVAFVKKVAAGRKALDYVV